MRTASTKSHRKSGERRRTAVRRISAAARDRNRKRLFAFLSTHPCADCGEADPVVLEFDHLPGTGKEQSISDLVTKGYAWEKVAAEIAKCEVACVNCHKRRTARRRPPRAGAPDPFREHSRRLLRQVLEAGHCVDCQETDPEVLEFDHRDPSQKTDAVANVVGRVAWTQVYEETQKCDIRCGNCHRRRTAARGQHHHLRHQQAAPPPPS